MSRLPRAEDKVALYINVDGTMVEALGSIERITLHATRGMNMLTGQMIGRIHPSGEITIRLDSMEEVELDTLGQGQQIIIQMPPEGSSDALPT